MIRALGVGIFLGVTLYPLFLPAQEFDPTAMATQSCLRKMAQLAAQYRPRGLTAQVLDGASLIERRLYQVRLLITIEYRNEIKQSVVVCVVNSYGRVETFATRE